MNLVLQSWTALFYPEIATYLLYMEFLEAHQRAASF